MPFRQHSAPVRRKASRLPAGAALLLLSTLLAAATIGLVLPTGNAVYCDRLAPLGVLAALAAALIALCFRALARSGRPLPPALLLGLVLASASLLASAGFLKRYHAACGQLQQRFHKS